MNSDFFSDFRALLSQLWQYQPFIIILVCAGFLIFLLVVIDSHRHRKKQKGRHTKKLH